LTERLTGVPLAVIDTPAIRRMGLRAGSLERWLLRNPRTKHFMRSLYAVRTAWSLKRGARVDRSQLWQAGKSVSGIHSIEAAGAIVRRWASALAAAS
jgi:nitronate monooxygenase